MLSTVIRLSFLLAIAKCNPVTNQHICSWNENENLSYSYLACATCSENFHISVNNDDNFGGFSPSTKVGTTRTKQFSIGNNVVKYKGILLASRRHEGNMTCKVVLVILSHPPDEVLNVTCQGRNEEATVSNGLRECPLDDTVNDKMVSISRIWNLDNIIPTFSIQGFVCKDQGGPQYWLANRTLIGTFDSEQSPVVVVPHESNETAFVVALPLLLERDGLTNQILNSATLLVVAMPNSDDDFVVTCESNNQSVNYFQNLMIGTTTMATRCTTFLLTVSSFVSAMFTTESPTTVSSDDQNTELIAIPVSLSLAAAAVVAILIAICLKRLYWKRKRIERENAKTEKRAEGGYQIVLDDINAPSVNDSDIEIDGVSTTAKSSLLSGQFNISSSDTRGPRRRT